MNFPKPKLSIPFLLLVLASLAAQSNAQGFKCSQQRATCQSLIGYKTPNATTLFHLSNFFHLRNPAAIAAANSLPAATPSNHTFPADRVLRIPIPCRCSNGTGASDRVPVYTVQPDDGLYYIANDVFMGLVTSGEIQVANEIEDADLIRVGEKLRIPLPCSCDDVAGERVVHYAHVVEEGTTVELIAERFGTTSEVLYGLNGIANDSQLIAETAFDVPLKACNSSVSADSPDYPLLVANGTSVLTANNCVKCSCNSANNWTLQCEPSGLEPTVNSTWSTCPSMQCHQSSLSLGNTTTTSCNTQICTYSGYSNQAIMTSLSTVNTCPSPPGGDSPGNYASTMGSSWKFLLVFLHLAMLSVSFLIS